LVAAQPRCGELSLLNVLNDWNILNDLNPRNAVIFCELCISVAKRKSRIFHRRGAEGAEGTRREDKTEARRKKIDSLEIRGIIGCPIFVVNRMKRTVFGIDLTRDVTTSAFLARRAS